ncbi:flagellar motor protein MotD [Chitinimonas sp.]|uniref:flagellar motor protein MotD n=1 Tax=Chitinimonas sp. TaxID=1934313 RepID=UPI002F9585FF
MARKHKPEDHENHERWLVSYADFITLLFAFFVVMYAISQVNEGKYKVLSNSLTVAFNKPDASTDALIKNDPNGNNQSLIALPYRQRREAAQVQQLVQERAQQAAAMKDMAVELKQDLAKLIDQGQVRVTESKRGIAIEVNASLLFPVGSATLDAKSAGSLSSIAQKLAGSDNLIQIEGHTDNVPIASTQFPSNWELSAARAGTVVRLFEANGVAAKRLVALGYAENRPVEPNDSAEGRARNRRVTIQILADNKDEVATLPMPGTQVPAQPAPAPAQPR